MNYRDLERILLVKINNIKAVRPYQCDNIITPNVVGFVPIGNGYKYEVAYGDFMGEWIVGLTPFYNGRLMENRKDFSRPFLENEIDDINGFIEEMKEKLLARK